MTTPQPGDIVVFERGTSTWNYHLREVGADGFKPSGVVAVMLCGQKMHGWDTQSPVKSYGDRSSHIPMTFCRVCGDEARKRGVETASV